MTKITNKKYTKKSFEENAAEVKELISDAQKQMESYFYTPENMKEYLSFMSKFYNYSINNSMLIEMQFPGASAVGSFKFWKEKGFNITKGEKGIKIITRNKGKDKFLNENDEWVDIAKASKKEKEKIIKGVLEVRKGKAYYSRGYVYDISQTNAKAHDLPKIFPGRWLDGKVENYNVLYKGMEQIAKNIGVKIVEPKFELGAVKGVSNPFRKEVALNPRNTQLQNVKTLLHELAHAKLHTAEKRDKYSKAEKEFQAELTAYTVCSYFGIDTSEYSLRYLKSWTDGKDLNDKKNLLNEVHQTAIEYIEILEDTLIKETSISKENEEDVFLNLENKVKDGMYAYYNQAPEEAVKVYSINDIKEYIASYMEPFFGDVDTNELKDWDKEVEEWNIEDIKDWFIGNEIVLSKESPQELIENNYKKEGENEMLKPKKDEKELRKMIREHEEWLNTKGVKGKRLDLENENLQGLKFLNLDLRSANFKGADLTDCIIYADLREADLTGTKIKNTNFIGSNLNKTTIEANKLNLIEHQIKFEEDKHKSGLKSLKTSKAKQNDISK